MFFDPHWSVIVGLNALAWLVLSFAVGFLMARRPASAMVPRRLGRIRAWEDHGRWYRRVLRVHRWKDRLPEAGSWFGGLDKRRLPRTEQGGVVRFGQECLRAERTHGWVMAAFPVFWLWNPPAAIVVNGVFAVVANLPCLIVGRSNRARVEHIVARRARPA